MALSLFAMAAILGLAVFQAIAKRMLYQRLAFYAFCGGTAAISVVVLFATPSALLLTAAVAWVGVIAASFLNLRAIIACLAPLATLILLLYLLFTADSLPATSVASNTMLGLHVLLAICGEAFAIGACALAIIYLWQRHILKKKLLKWVGIDTPALDRIGRSLLFCLWTGFAFLTIGLLTGAVYSKLYTHALHEGLRLKIIWALAVWGWYLAILVSNRIFNSSPRWVAHMSLGGFVLLALALFGLAWQQVSI